MGINEIKIKKSSCRNIVLKMRIYKLFSKMGIKMGICEIKIKKSIKMVKKDVSNEKQSYNKLLIKMIIKLNRD